MSDSETDRAQLRHAREIDTAECTCHSCEVLPLLHEQIAQMCEHLGSKRDDVPCDSWHLRDLIVKQVTVLQTVTTERNALLEFVQRNYRRFFDALHVSKVTPLGGKLQIASDMQLLLNWRSAEARPIHPSPSPAPPESAALNARLAEQCAREQEKPDQQDSAALEKLRMAIDDADPWPSEAARDAGDYESAVLLMASERQALLVVAREAAAMLDETNHGGLSHRRSESMARALRDAPPAVADDEHEDVGDKPVADIDAEMLINGHRRKFVESVQYYLNELLDDDNPPHAIGHIESECADYSRLIRAAVRVYGTGKAESSASRQAKETVAEFVAEREEQLSEAYDSPARRDACAECGNQITDFPNRYMLASPGAEGLTFCCKGCARAWHDKHPPEGAP